MIVCNEGERSEKKMDYSNIIKTVKTTKEYEFLRDDEHLGDNIIILGLGGSYAYGTNKEGSDIDVRGIATNTSKEILLMRDFEQVVDTITDTTIYSLQKIVSLLCNCNPNTIEMLGLRPEQYLYISEIGRLLVDNKKLFLSKRAINSFGGYANQQLYRLNQKAKHALAQEELEKHILKTIQFMQASFTDRYATMPADSIKLYVDKATQPNMDTEIYIDGEMHHVSLRDFSGMLGEFNNTIKQYGKIGKRNEHAIEHQKIGKHMMHLVRLYHMCFDILEKGEINTYREEDHDLLMSIRNGAFLQDDNQPIPEFFEMVDELEKRLEEDSKHTDLPEEPQRKEIEELICTINEKIVKNELISQNDMSFTNWLAQ